MYGTVARFRVKAGMEEAFREYGVQQQQNRGSTPGQRGFYLYQMDNNPREFYMVAIFDDRDSYHANAQSPEQHERFMEFVQFMEAEPEWHDGEIVAAESR